MERAWMLEEIDPLDFVLAELLHKHLYEIRALPNLEVMEWRARLVYLKAMQEMETNG